jgi:hypothetical protein
MLTIKQSIVNTWCAQFCSYIYGLFYYESLRLYLRCFINYRHETEC